MNTPQISPRGTRPSISRTSGVAFVGMLCLLLWPRAGRADLVVHSGYDLLVTQMGTTFDGIDFKSSPIGNFNFGGSVGMQNTGSTDTIIHRLTTGSVAAPGQTATVPIFLDALELKTTSPTKAFYGLGGGLDNYFITLSGSHASAGDINITFADDNGGTFSSSNFKIYFDVRKHSATGSIITSGNVTLTSSGTAWGRMPAPGPGVNIIDGVNHILKGDGTISQDFWPQGTIHEDSSGAAHHFVSVMPEPSTVALGGFGALGLLGYGLRRWWGQTAV